MRKIRKNVFETNSSSMHSVCIRGRKRLDRPNLPILPLDNKVISEFGEFGWEIENYSDQETKLSYLLTMIAETSYRKENKCDFYELDDFKMVEDVICKYCNCEGIKLKGEFEVKRGSWDGKEYYYLDFDEYIDHQSHEDYSCLQDFLDDYGVTIEEFIFSPNVILHTDNDNN